MQFKRAMMNILSWKQFLLNGQELHPILSISAFSLSPFNFLLFSRFPVSFLSLFPIHSVILFHSIHKNQSCMKNVHLCISLKRITQSCLWCSVLDDFLSFQHDFFLSSSLSPSLDLTLITSFHNDLCGDEDGNVTKLYGRRGRLCLETRRTLHLFFILTALPLPSVQHSSSHSLFVFPSHCAEGFFLVLTSSGQIDCSSSCHCSPSSLLFLSLFISFSSSLFQSIENEYFVEWPNTENYRELYQRCFFLASSQKSDEKEKTKIQCKKSIPRVSTLRGLIFCHSVHLMILHVIPSSSPFSFSLHLSISFWASLSPDPQIRGPFGSLVMRTRLFEKRNIFTIVFCSLSLYFFAFSLLLFSSTFGISFTSLVSPSSLPPKDQKMTESMQENEREKGETVITASGEFLGARRRGKGWMGKRKVG